MQENSLMAAEELTNVNLVKLESIRLSQGSIHVPDAPQGTYPELVQLLASGVKRAKFRMPVLPSVTQ